MKNRCFILLLFCSLVSSCAHRTSSSTADVKSDRQQVLQVMQQHLDAVSHKDLDAFLIKP